MQLVRFPEHDAHSEEHASQTKLLLEFGKDDFEHVVPQVQVDLSRTMLIEVFFLQLEHFFAVPLHVRQFESHFSQKPREFFV